MVNYKGFITVPEAAKKYNLEYYQHDWLRDKIRKGHIRAFKRLGVGCWFVEEKSLAEFMSDEKQKQFNEEEK